MRYRGLGKRGPKVSVIGLGFWQAGSKAWAGRSSDVISGIKIGVQKALELGINFFDTAEVYGNGFSERLLGELVGNRDDVIIATKVAGYRTSIDSILKAAEASRRRLRRDRIDLLQYHWPPPIYSSLCKIIRGLEKTVDKGIAEYIGLSNFPRKLLEKAITCTHKYEIVSNQLQYSLAYRVVENGLKQFMEENNISLIAWSPLAKGALAGVTRASTIAQRTDKVFQQASNDRTLQATLERIARKHGATKAQIALAWLIHKKSLPIPGFRRPNRVEENAKAALIKLTEDELRELDNVSRKYVDKVYGKCYGDLHSLRLIPGPLQHMAIRLLGGV